MQVSRAPHAAPFVAIPVADALDLREVLVRLRRRRWVAICAAAFAFAVLAAVILSLTPRYRAEATVMLEGRHSRVLAFEQVLPQLPGDLEAVQSEVEVLGSRNLARRTVAELRLTEDPEFNPTLRDGGFLDRVRGWVNAQIGTVLGRPDEGPLSPAEVETLAVNVFLSKLRVRSVGRSRAIEIVFTSEDPELAAEAVNTHARLYVEAQVAAKLQATRRARDYLGAQASELGERVRRAEAAAEEYRNNARLLEARDGLQTKQALAEAQGELTVATGRREDAEARLAQVRDPARRQSVPEVIGSLLIGRLREQEALLRRDATQFDERFGPRHPTAVETRASLVDLQRRIGQEIDKIAASLRTEADTQAARETRMRERVEEAQARVMAANEAEVRLRALNREADAARGLLQALLTREQEVSAAEALQASDAAVVSDADVPLRPSFPRTMIFLAAAALGSAGLGCATGIMLGRSGDGLRSMDDVEPLVAAPALGLVPALEGRRQTAEGAALGLAPPTRLLRRGGRPALSGPGSVFAGSVRAVLTNLMAGENPPRAVLVASALPGEGKTSAALSLGRLASLMGFRALVLDADLRRPSVHARAVVPRGPGLRELLAGTASPSEVLQSDGLDTGLKVVCCGEGGGDPAKLLLRNERLALALEEWRRDFDIVIVDSPPLVPVADALLIARQCDQVVFVAQWETTHRAVVQGEIERLRAFGAHVAGVVLTRVDLRRHAAHSYSGREVLRAYEYR